MLSVFRMLLFIRHLSTMLIASCEVLRQQMQVLPVFLR